MDIEGGKVVEACGISFSSRGSGSLVDFGRRGAGPAAEPELRKVLNLI